ncbi:trichohyalin-like [Engraulis encrasicolus]|uniref:trichohyalin-like n=1 Tax=Engraulis encrasicolus TaxID=184585 RepID=UPI002FD0E14C
MVSKVKVDVPQQDDCKTKVEELQRVVQEMRAEMDNMKAEAECKASAQQQLMEQVMGQWRQQERQLQEREDERRQGSLRPPLDEQRKKALLKKARALREKKEQQERSVKDDDMQKRKQQMLQRARALRRKQEQEKEAQERKLKRLEKRLAALEMERRDAPPMEPLSLMDQDALLLLRAAKAQDKTASPAQIVCLESGDFGESAQDKTLVGLQAPCINKTEGKITGVKEHQVDTNTEGGNNGLAKSSTKPKKRSFLSWIKKKLGLRGH